LAQGSRGVWAGPALRLSQGTMNVPFEEYQGNLEPSVKAVNAEYETEIHFQKCWGVMAEIFEAHNNLDSVIPRTGFRFLDLGCAPGGFSSYLLDDPRCLTGFGVTLPSTSGGFPVRVRSNRFFLQQADLFEIAPTDLIASEVHICVCDAQYLRNNISWDERYRGVRCRSKQHGVWAILLKQFWLGLTRLAAGGVLIFRFGWRDPGPDDPATIWYKKMTLRLFSLLIDLFGQVREVKSDYFNALQSSFYVCCSNFRKERFVERQGAKLLGINFNYLISTRIEDSNDLDILAPADRIRTEEVDNRISDMLDRIEKLRLINEQSRKWHRRQEALHDDPRAVVFLAPPPSGMGDEDLMASFSVYGRVLRVDRSSECQVSVQLALPEQARVAVAALRSSGAFGETIRIWTQGEEGQQVEPAGTVAPPLPGQRPPGKRRLLARPPPTRGRAATHNRPRHLRPGAPPAAPPRRRAPRARAPRPARPRARPAAGGRAARPTRRPRNSTTTAAPSCAQTATSGNARRLQARPSRRLRLHRRPRQRHHQPPQGRLPSRLHRPPARLQSLCRLATHRRSRLPRPLVPPLRRRPRRWRLPRPSQRRRLPRPRHRLGSFHRPQQSPQPRRNPSRALVQTQPRSRASTRHCRTTRRGHGS